MDFKLNQVLDRILDEHCGDVDLNEDLIRFHGLVADTINQFIVTEVSKQVNCKQNWVNNKIKNLASLKKNLYQNFVRDKSEAI